MGIIREMDYLKSQKIIHWIMAFLIILDLNIAQKFGGEMELLDRLESRVDHATVGTIITFLFVLRLALRYFYGAPNLPSTMPKWQIYAAHIGHYGLYTLMGLLMITGFISASFASEPIIIFNNFNLAFAGHNDNLFMLFRGVHEFCTNAIIFLIIVHIVAALYHHFIAKDRTTIKMLKFWTAKAN